MGINALRRGGLGCRAPLLDFYTTPIMPLEFPRKYNFWITEQDGHDGTARLVESGSAPQGEHLHRHSCVNER